MSGHMIPQLARLGALALALAAATPAEAYIGPGVGLGAVSVALGVIGSILLGIFSVLWYPFKRLIRRIRRRPGGPEPRG